jgi:alpha-1,2-mannosyltransferase
VLIFYEGFHATTAEQYAEGFRKALTLSPEETLAMRLRARKSSERFTDATFDGKWLETAEKLVTLQIKRAAR